MGWSGGSYTKGNAATGGWTGDASLGIGIEAGRHDTQDNDFATGINQCINKDGSNSFTGNPNLGGFIPTNLAAGTATAPAVCVGNDVNTGIFGPAADTWAVATNGTEKLRVTSTGDIGINVTPDAFSAFALSHAKTNTLISKFSADAGGTNFIFQKSRSATLNANTVVQSGDGIGSLVWQGANGTAYNNAAAISAEVDGTPGLNDMPGRLVFSTTPDGVSSVVERVRIDSTGKVGIGTTAPKEVFQITTNSTVSPTESGGSTGTTLGFNYYYSSGTKALTTGNRTVTVEMGNNGGILKSTTGTQTANAAVSGLNPYISWGGFGDLIQFYTGNTERMRIDNQGRVGIGEASAGSKLHVREDLSGYTGIATNNQDQRLELLSFYQSGVGQFGAVQAIVNSTGGANALVLNPNGGNVSIGSTSAVYRLQVNIDSAAKPTTNTWTIASDERIKTNIQNYTKGLAEICQVRPVSYDYNGKGGFEAGPGGVSIIAQEIEPIFPECVGSVKAKLEPEDTEEVDLLNYNGHAITFALINAVKELNTKVETLEARVAELEA